MLDEDGLPLDDVGIWAKEKHDRLRKYVDISRGVRKKWVLGTGGATYIDLYCGAGRAAVRETGERIDGSPLVAFKAARDGGAPFAEVYIADQAEGRCRAAEQRLLRAGASPKASFGPAEFTAAQIAAQLNPSGLHLVFLDPFNLQDLPFSVIETFRTFKYLDMLIHVSAQDLQRNLVSYSASLDSPLDRFAPGWRDSIDNMQSQAATRMAFIRYWMAKMEGIGLPPGRSELITGSKNQRLYWLVGPRQPS
jgi:three-Cys-motif partner protein